MGYFLLIKNTWQSTVDIVLLVSYHQHLLNFSLFSWFWRVGGDNKGDGHRQKFLSQSKHYTQLPKARTVFFLVSILGFLVNTVDLPIYLPSVKASLYLHPLNTQDIANLGRLPVSPHVLLRMSLGGLVRGTHTPSRSQAIKGRGDYVFDFILLPLVCVGPGAKILPFYCISLVS